MATIRPALFLISFAALTFEISLTRIFSVMLSYHYVFAVVSFALFGLALGAILLKSWQRVTPEWSFYVSGALFALSIPISIIAILGLPIASLSTEGQLGFWIYISFSAIPFTLAGLTIAGVFQEYPERSSSLYAFDLLGATIAASAAVPLFDRIGGIGVALSSAPVAGLAAVLTGVRAKTFPTLGVISLLLGLVAFLFVVLHVFSPTVPIGRNHNKDMFHMLSNPLGASEVVESRWSAFGRTDLVASARRPNEMTLFVDGAAGSVMYAKSIFEDSEEAGHLTHHYGQYFPFRFLSDEEKDSALIIGSGGGRDVVVALLGGVKEITAVEVNPEIVEIVKDHEAFNGGIYSGMRNVKAVVQEGRHFIRNSRETYDLIMLAIPVTKSSRSVEGYSLTENYLFTAESFEDYLDHLTPEGRIVIVAHSTLEVYRLVSLAVEAFRRRGLNEEEAFERMYTFSTGMMPTMVIRNEPFTPSDTERRHEMIHKLGYDRHGFYLPHVEQVAFLAQSLAAGQQITLMMDEILFEASKETLKWDEVVRAAVRDIGVVTDDRPFFYKFRGGLHGPLLTFEVLILMALAGLTVLVFSPRRLFLFGGSFFPQLAERVELRALLVVFFLLGIGFMLLEIALFQKLLLYIGNPLQALSVLLFCLFLGAGLGSLASSRVQKRLVLTISVTSSLAAFLAIIYSFYHDDIFAAVQAPSTAAAVMLVPLGFVLGFPFPLGIRLLKSWGHDEFTYVMWGTNGITSVLGSALAMIVGMTIGFSFAIYLGAVLYGIVAVSIRLTDTRSGRSPRRI
ncbi:MAG: hypothetical protein GTO51_07685 [Candidatus Latescibacteria bacterium]|nr:hypothetical protein [Candidatus Latescibacterota bacterium]NIO29245.1 hypothetical protein [Candidatus Latescibacterota bacterium]NIO56869.1 hypothetical protein [Candidatus Latescibacterota bacterium]